jgi:photoactive yellow protein
MSTLTQSDTFVDKQVLDNLGSLNEQNIEKLPYGVVKLDDDGNIELYNQYNYEHFADFQGKSVIGKNYFEEVAPCSNNFIFSGRFKRGVENDFLNSVFDYCFTYKMMPTNVRIHLYRDPDTKTNWIFLKALD